MGIRRSIHIVLLSQCEFCYFWVHVSKINNACIREVGLTLQEHNTALEFSPIFDFSFGHSWVYRRYGEIQQHKTILLSETQKAGIFIASPCDLDVTNLAGLPGSFEDLGFSLKHWDQVAFGAWNLFLFPHCQSKEPQLFDFTLFFVCGVSYCAYLYWVIWEIFN